MIAPLKRVSPLICVGVPRGPAGTSVNLSAFRSGGPLWTRCDSWPGQGQVPLLEERPVPGNGRAWIYEPEPFSKDSSPGLRGVEQGETKVPGRGETHRVAPTARNRLRCSTAWLLHHAAIRSKCLS